MAAPGEETAEPAETAPARAWEMAAHERHGVYSLVGDVCSGFHLHVDVVAEIERLMGGDPR